MYQDIIRLLDEYRLKEALEQLKKMAGETENWALREEVENWETTYSYMLRYASQGIADPEREKLYQSVRNATYGLADSAQFQLKNKTASGFFAERYRQTHLTEPCPLREVLLVLESFGESLGMTQLTVQDEAQQKAEKKRLYHQHDKRLNQLFDWIWTSPLWTSGEMKEMEEFVHSQRISADDICVLVSAATLSLIHLFDRRKLMFLIDVYRTRAELVVAQRALIGIALTLYFHESRVKLYSELIELLGQLRVDKSVSQRLFDFQLFLLYSREAEKIERKLNNDIIPQMLKEYGSQIKGMSAIDMGEMIGQNPEWKAKMEELKESITELGQFQMECADMNMATFSQLKSYPFFYQPANWFYLFDRQRMEVEGLFSGQSESARKFVDSVVSTPMLCDSDRYSFCFTMHNIPQEQMGIFGESLSEGFDMPGASEDTLPDTASERENSLGVLSRYIHDLDRFCKLWIYRDGGVRDIFKEPVPLWNSHLLKSLFGTGKRMFQISEFLFEKEYWDDALDIYLELSNDSNVSAEVWQKIGYIYQKRKEYDEAIKAYTLAEIMQPEDVWTWEGLAQCHRRGGHYTKALEYYEKLEKAKPDNLSYTSLIGQCYVNMQEYEKALPYFFKVEFLGKTPEKAWRAIAWCQFMIGKLDESETFYQKLTQSPKMQPLDWLNYGHLLLVRNRVSEALDCYRKVLSENCSRPDFVKLFMDDADVLKEKGLSAENIYMLPDML